jgi:2-hydroxychromene-2-carboxylate isomerase
MAAIDFYFDFASPYAWFAFRPLRALTRKHGRELKLRPMLLWAVLQQRGMPPPLEHAAKKDYLLHDMARSARYYGLPFRMPDAFPTSSHLPARLFLQLDENDATQAAAFAEAVFRAYFEDNIDLRNAETLIALAVALGIDAGWARTALVAEHGKQLLQAANANAVAAGVWGSPYIIVDGEAYFGADRLPQIEAQLQGTLT